MERTHDIDQWFSLKTWFIYFLFNIEIISNMNHQIGFVCFGLDCQKASSISIKWFVITYSSVKSNITPKI